MTHGTKIMLAVALLSVAALAGWYWYTNYSTGGSISEPNAG